MSLIEPNGRPHIFCSKCKANVVWPASLSSEEKSRFAAEARESPLAAVKLTHERLGLNLREAKALAFHVTRSVANAIAVTDRCKAKRRSVGNADPQISIGDPAGIVKHEHPKI
jgi:hypothetical protein